MTDQTIPEEAIEAAARVLHAELNAPKFAIGSCLKCRRDAERMLTSAYPHLRQQIETEVRRQVEAEIEQMESAWYFGGPHAPGVRVVSLEGALLAARGAAQPGGEQSNA